MAKLTVVSASIILTLLNFGQAKFLVKPESLIVAPNSMASFDCAVRRDAHTVMFWSLNNYNIHHNELPPAGSSYKAVWYDAFNSTLYIDASISINDSKIECKFATNETHKSTIAKLLIAGPPLRPAGFQVHYDKTKNSVGFQWEAPFTHSPIFPILNFTAKTYCLQSGKKMSLQTSTIDGTKTTYSIQSLTNELCFCNKVCVHLTASNSIGTSKMTESCTDIVKDTEPFPINISLTTQQDGQTLVTVLFQKPHCIPQRMQPHIVVQEVPSMTLDDLYNVSTLPDLSKDDVMESHMVAKMQKNKVYEVKIYLESKEENISSLPTFVFSSGTVELDKGDESGGPNVVGIAIAITMVLIIIAVVIVAVICVLKVLSKQPKSDKHMVGSTMQPNPLYEGALYCTIPMASPKSYDNNIYQAAPGSSNDKISDLYEDLPPPCAMDTPSEYKTHEQRTDVVEGDYIVMRSCSISGSPMPMQTDV